MSAQMGGDQILIAKDDKNRTKGPFWIGVRGHKEAATYSIKVLKGIISSSTTFRPPPLSSPPK